MPGSPTTSTRMPRPASAESSAARNVATSDVRPTKPAAPLSVTQRESYNRRGFSGQPDGSGTGHRRRGARLYSPNVALALRSANRADPLHACLAEYVFDSHPERRSHAAHHRGFHTLTSRLFRMARSWVASGRRCARAVAMMSRSAGSPWNVAGRLARAMTTSTSKGTISTTPTAAASRIQTSKARSSVSLPLACNICASHRLTAARRPAPRDPRRSRPQRSLAGSRGDPKSHHSQTCVSRRINDRP